MLGFKRVINFKNYAAWFQIDSVFSDLIRKLLLKFIILSQFSSNHLIVPGNNSRVYLQTIQKGLKRMNVWFC